LSELPIVLYRGNDPLGIKVTHAHRIVVLNMNNKTRTKWICIQ
jgi:hypothetical protein